MKKNVFIFGISGRMGQEIASIVDRNSTLNLIGGYSKEQTNLDLETAPDIVIDFSLPETFDSLKTFIQKYQPALVSGTTGLSDNQKQELTELGNVAPVFWAANMSFGVYLMCKLTETLAQYQQFYNYHIEETHHVHKKDKPSGTALIVEDAARKSTSKLGETVSLREGEVFGIHSFIAESPNERLEIKHEAHNRGLFAQGAVDISMWLSQQPKGFYTMDDFFMNFQTSDSAKR